MYVDYAFVVVPDGNGAKPHAVSMVCGKGLTFASSHLPGL